MGARAEYWRALVAELKRAGVTSKAYAEQHGLSVHSLRHWVSRLKADASMNTAAQAGGFVALCLDRTAAPVRTAVVGGCTLRCGAGWELELTALPSPQWLAGLSMALREVR